MDTCLLVIDVQESFRHRPYWDESGLQSYLAAQNRLIAYAGAEAMPIIRIFHTSAPAEAGNPFALESGLIRNLDGLRDYQPAATFIKSRHSALVGTGLGVWLTRHGIRKVLVSGIRTEQCCETTTRHLSDEGWTVDFVLDATLTFAMVQADGTILSPADLYARTATVLQDRFATVTTVAQLAGEFNPT